MLVTHVSPCLAHGAIHGSDRQGHKAFCLPLASLPLSVLCEAPLSPASHPRCTCLCSWWKSSGRPRPHTPLSKVGLGGFFNSVFPIPSRKS